MGYLVEISDSKIEKMGEYVEDMLWAGGELMHCIEKMKEEHGGYGHRERQGGRYGSGYGSRYGGGYMGYRDDDDMDDDEMMGERRGRRRRDSRGRYM